MSLLGVHCPFRPPSKVSPSSQAAGGTKGLAVAGRYASGVMGAPYSIEDAVAERASISDAAAPAGRDPDEVKYVAGIMPAIAPTKRAALDRHLALGEHTFPQRLAHLGQMLGENIPLSQLDRPLPQGELAAAQASPLDQRSEKALKLAREGWDARRRARPWRH